MDCINKHKNRTKAPCAEVVDILNYQAIDLLERFGNEQPNEEQIVMMESLIAAAQLRSSKIKLFDLEQRKFIH